MFVELSEGDKKDLETIDNLTGKTLYIVEHGASQVMDLFEEGNSQVVIDDSTGKTGLALSSLTDKDVKDGKSIVVVDLDSGNLPLILEHHRDKLTAGAIKYRDPVIWNKDEAGRPVLDYKNSEVLEKFRKKVNNEIELFH